MKDDARRMQIYFKVNDEAHSALVQYLGRMKLLKRKDVVMRWILQGCLANNAPTSARQSGLTPKSHGRRTIPALRQRQEAATMSWPS